MEVNGTRGDWSEDVNEDVSRHGAASWAATHASSSCSLNRVVMSSCNLAFSLLYSSFSLFLLALWRFFCCRMSVRFGLCQ